MLSWRLDRYMVTVVRIREYTIVSYWFLCSVSKQKEILRILHQLGKFGRMGKVALSSRAGSYIFQKNKRTKEPKKTTHKSIISRKMNIIINTLSCVAFNEQTNSPLLFWLCPSKARIYSAWFHELRRHQNGCACMDVLWSIFFRILQKQIFFDDIAIICAMAFLRFLAACIGSRGWSR